MAPIDEQKIYDYQLPRRAAHDLKWSFGVYLFFFICHLPFTFIILILTLLMLNIPNIFLIISDICGFGLSISYVIFPRTNAERQKPLILYGLIIYTFVKVVLFTVNLFLMFLYIRNYSYDIPYYQDFYLILIMMSAYTFPIFHVISIFFVRHKRWIVTYEIMESLNIQIERPIQFIAYRAPETEPFLQQNMANDMSYRSHHSGQQNISHVSQLNYTNLENQKFNNEREEQKIPSYNSSRIQNESSAELSKARLEGSSPDIKPVMSTQIPVPIVFSPPQAPPPDMSGSSS